MNQKSFILVLFVCCLKNYIEALSFPGPRVYVVTPAARPLENDDGKFYYHKWMRRMDSFPNVTTTTTTTTTAAPKQETPDLIFAEFESGANKQKSIRKLLEKEKVSSKSTTMSPIYVPDVEENRVTRVVNYGLPVKIENHANADTEMSTEKTDYSFMHHEDYYNKAQAPVYIPSKTTPKFKSTTTTTTSTTTESAPINIENIWHIIDNEKINQYSGNWHEVPVDDDENSGKESEKFELPRPSQLHEDDKGEAEQNQSDTIDENFAIPGFTTNSGSGAENESRAIRTEPVIRFPYVNLKPFQMKSSKKTSLSGSPNSKKNNNMLISLDQFTDLKHPVRGEAQDILPLESQIDRYNPAQPYLPQPPYGSKVSKQSSPVSSPPKATANLVPPPPPPPPPKANDDFPAPASYESFPPYAPSAPDFGSVSSQSISDPIDSLDTSSSVDTSSDNEDGPQMDLGYRYKLPIATADSGPVMGMGYQYKPPSAPVPQFIPTIPPSPKPFAGYSYNKPSIDTNSAPVIGKPEFQGYHYNKPEAAKPSHDYMPPSYDSPPTYGPSPSYGHDDKSPHEHDSDYPELLFSKPNYHGSDDMKGSDMGMVPPPPPPSDMQPDMYGSPPSDMKPDLYGPPPDDHGFPSDFPTDFKFHHDFDEHDHYHHHHPTTTSTEMPRVNRFSYYYLGKKLYYLPLYFSVYFIVYVGALIIKAVLRHKIVYPNSWRPNSTTATFFSKRSVDDYLSNDNLHEVTKKVTHALATAAEKYINAKKEA